MKVSLTALALASLTLAPIAVAQNTHPQTDRTKGTELVAWTQDQKPAPMPSTQTTPPAQKPQTETPSTPATSGQNSGQKAAATQSFTGTVVKSGDTYVLKTSDNMTYQLDDQARAKDYEGKQVQITGSLDATSNTIKVQEIKAAS